MTIRPEDHRDEILRLYDEEEYSQAKIIRHFQEKYGELKRSTLSDFLKSQSRNGTAEVLGSEAQPGALAPAMPEAGTEVSEQFTVLADFYKANADELIEKQAMVMEGLQQLHQDGSSRHEALNSKLDTVLSRLRGEVPSSVLRRIFGRGVLAGMLLVGVPGAVVLVTTPVTVFRGVWLVRDSVMWIWAFLSRLFT
jgi:hypothetical protein